MLASQSKTKLVHEIEFYQRSLSIIVSLTKQLDSLSLIDCLLTRLSKTSLVKMACIYEVHHTNSEFIRSAADSSQLIFKQVMERPWQAKDTTAAPEIAVDSFLAHKQMTQRIEGKVREIVTFPIIPEEGQIGHILLFECTDLLAVKNLLAGHVMTVFCNLLTIFDRMERDVVTGLYNAHTLNLSLIRYARLALILAHDANRQANREWLAMLKIVYLNQAQTSTNEKKEITLHIACELKSVFRNTDLQFRYSEDEFVMVLVCDHKSGVESALDRFLVNTKQHKIIAQRQVQLLVSFAEFNLKASASETVREVKKSLSKLKGQKPQAACCEEG
ncbi:hypothetical protein [Catenovulum sediminis]|uniref:GGDEF domain-containing protein n=1 Tax=Catenovulum sediminis TaxID=1740262 RepID=A0ABV1RCJ2_9ALTE|nr:hypothetical protein [Catenovulum sediminis]